MTAEILGDHDVRRELRPALGDLDIVLLENDFALLVPDRGGAQLPFDRIKGVDVGLGEVTLDGQACSGSGTLVGLFARMSARGSCVCFVRNGFRSARRVHFRPIEIFAHRFPTLIFALRSIRKSSRSMLSPASRRLFLICTTSVCVGVRRSVGVGRFALIQPSLRRAVFRFVAFDGATGSSSLGLLFNRR